MNNEPAYSSWSKYHWALRILALLGVLMAVFLCSGVLFCLWDLWGRAHSNDPAYHGIFLAVELFFSLLMLVTTFLLFPRFARSAWVLIYEFRYSETSVEAYDPILRRRWSVRFNEVHRVRPFYLGGPPVAKAGFGWVLETELDGRIPLCEALPIWPEIMRHCAQAEFVALPAESLERLNLHL